MNHWNADISFGQSTDIELLEYEVDTDQGNQTVLAYSFAHARRLIEEMGLRAAFITVLS